MYSGKMFSPDEKAMNYAEKRKEIIAGYKERELPIKPAENKSAKGYDEFIILAAIFILLSDKGKPDHLLILFLIYILI